MNLIASSGVQDEITRLADEVNKLRTATPIVDQRAEVSWLRSALLFLQRRQCRTSSGLRASAP